MKLTIKTLQQKQLQLQVSEDDTVSSVKSKIHETENVDPARQMLIFQGKILSDDQTIGSYDIKETDFVVMMATKPPAKASAIPNAADSKPKPSEIQPGSSSTTAKETTGQHTAQKTDTSSLVTGAAYETAVQNLMEMGFERDQVIHALKASYNNPDRAAEYLFSGHIPTESVEQEASSSSLEFLRNDPYFQQIREAIRRNPQSIPALLHQIGSTNPRLLELINDNQEQFISLLNEDLEPTEGEEYVEMTDEDEGDLGGHHVAQESAERTEPQQHGGNSGAPQLQFVQVTASEREAIDRLVALGFERSRATEAFLACDKDETLAANYLFDHMNDEDF